MIERLRHNTKPEPVMNYCPHCATLLVEKEHEGSVRPLCPACGFVYYRDPKVAVAVLVGQDDKVLLVRRGHEPGMGLWTFPSGFVDAGEIVEAAAVRETKEEAGVEVRLERLLAVRSEAENPVVLIVYTGQIVGGEPLPGPEATEARLFGINEIPELAFPHDAELLQAWATGRDLLELPPPSRSR